MKKMQLHTLKYAKQNCTINHAIKKMIKSDNNSLYFIGYRIFKKISQGSLRIIKKEHMNFNPIFSTNRIQIYQKYINKVCNELNHAPNGGKIILYYCKFIELSLVRNKYFEFLKYNYNACVFNLKTHRK
jgi:hypothetical protein